MYITCIKCASWVQYHIYIYIYIRLTSAALNLCTSRPETTYDMATYDMATYDMAS